MKNHACVSLLAAVFVLVFSSPAEPCQPPEPFLEVIATTPSNYATDVPTQPTISMQFQTIDGYYFDEHFGIYNDAPFVLTITGADGTLHTETEVAIEANGTGNELSQFMLEIDTLEPNSSYFATLAKSNTAYEWAFDTGPDDAPSVEEQGDLTIALDEYFAQRPVTDCCPIQFPGECPVCGTIGSEPVATASIGIRALQHAEGPGAWTYTVERRNAQGDTWEVEAKTATPESDIETLVVEILDNDLRRAETCFRVVAESIFDTSQSLTSYEICLDGPSTFSDPPAGERQPSGLVCADNDVEDPEDPDDPRESDDAEETDEETDRDSNAAVDGQDEIEWGGSSRESDGCGCASTSHGEVPGALVLLLGFFGLRRKAHR